MSFGRKSTDKCAYAAGGAMDAAPVSQADARPVAPFRTEQDIDAIRSMSAARDASATFGEIVMLLMRTAEYGGMPLRDLEALVMPPLDNGQISVATAHSNGSGTTTPVGTVLWASVSAEVAERLASQAGKTIPLAPKDWKSGDIVWVVAAVGEGRVLSEMLKQLSKRDWSGREVKIVVRPKDGKPTVATLAVQSSEAA
jgi:hemolysin-activating ACP:hemolysin acyltransferase